MISINIYEILMQMFNFVLLIWLLNKFLLKPLGNTLNQRANLIQTNIDESAQKKETSEKILEEQKTLLQKAHEEAKEVRKTAEETTKKEKEMIINQSKEEAGKLIQTAKKEIQNSYETAKNDLKNEVGTLAITLSEKLIHKNLDKQAQGQIISNYIGTIEN